MNNISYACVITVEWFINQLSKPATTIYVPQEIRHMIALMYAKPICMKIKYNQISEHIFLCPIYHPWNLVIGKIHATYDINPEKIQTSVVNKNKTMYDFDCVNLGGKIETDELYHSFGNEHSYQVVNETTWNTLNWTEMDVFTVPDNDMLCNVSLLSTMGFDKNYIIRAIKVHERSRFGTQWNLNILVEIMGLLEEKDSTIAYHFASVTEALELRIYDRVDYRCEDGRFILCCIVEKNIMDNNHIIKLKPVSYSFHTPLLDEKCFKYCNINLEYTKLAVAHSISSLTIPQLHVFSALEVNDYLDVNPLDRPGHKGWKTGKIVKMEGNSAQIEVLYYNDFGNTGYTYWFNLLNVEEVAEFRTKTMNDNL
eukprot:275009_1